MALTPEDVVNKRFQTTLTDGYDQDEVDDFLDDVVVELRRVILENSELRQRASQAEAAAAQAPAYQAPQSETPELDPSATNNLLQLARRLHEEHVREGMERRDALIAAGQEEATRLTTEAAAVQQAAASQQEEVARLQAEAEARLSEADVTVAAKLQEAETAAAQLVSGLEAAAAARIADQDAVAARMRDEAEAATKERLAGLEAEAAARVAEVEASSREAIESLRNEKLDLEAAVEGLRGFEREYRQQLRDFITVQLDQLDASAPTASGPVSSTTNPVPLVEPEAYPVTSEPVEAVVEAEAIEYAAPAPVETVPEAEGVADEAVAAEPVSWDLGDAAAPTSEPADELPPVFPSFPSQDEPPTTPRPPFSGFGDR